MPSRREMDCLQKVQIKGVSTISTLILSCFRSFEYHRKKCSCSRTVTFGSRLKPVVMVCLQRPQSRIHVSGIMGCGIEAYGRNADLFGASDAKRGILAFTLKHQGHDK